MEIRQFSDYSQFEKCLLFSNFSDLYQIPEKEKKAIIRIAAKDSDRLFAAAVQSYVEGNNFAIKLRSYLDFGNVEELLEDASNFKSIISETDYNNLSFYVIEEWLTAYQEKVEMNSTNERKNPIKKKVNFLYNKR